MAEVVPAINASDAADYAVRINRVKPFARRIHVDVCDGVFVAKRSPNLAQVYGIDQAELDLHLMLQDPAAEFEAIVALRPDLVIIHIESSGDIAALLARIKQLGIKTGLAVTAATTIAAVGPLLVDIDHLLLFTGVLGCNGGDFDANGLAKINPARLLNPALEIGVDGGINQSSARQAVAAGADILDSGSFIMDASDPPAAFAQLSAIAQGGRL